MKPLQGLMAEWNQYRGLQLDKVKALMKDNVFVDLRNLYERNLLEKYNFKYTSIGR